LKIREHVKNEVAELPTFIHALWRRIKFGVAICSNHEERNHRTVKAVCANVNNGPRRLHKVLKQILKSGENFNDPPNRQAKFLLKKLSDIATREGIISNSICTEATCGWSHFYSSLFNIPNFPCIHTVQALEIHFHPITKPAEILTPNNIIHTHVQYNYQPPVLEAEGTSGFDLEDYHTISGITFTGFIRETAHELHQSYPKKWPDFVNGCIQITQLYCESNFKDSDDLTEMEKLSGFRIELYQSGEK
jgi:hypothetical protein